VKGLPNSDLVKNLQNYILQDEIHFVSTAAFSFGKNGFASDPVAGFRKA
jgi:hypothetical protein